MNTLCVIGARGGSKGLPGKNVRPLLGKPMIAWSIEQAFACPEISRVIVSTDHPEIADVARAHGAEVPFVRPADLSNDTAGKWGVWRHALDFVEHEQHWPVDWFVDLDCTSPLRESADIQAAIALMLREQVDCVMSICEARKNPYFNLLEYEGAYLHLSKVPPHPVVSRQSAPAVFEQVASIYVFRPQHLRDAKKFFEGRTIGYPMPPERSLDVDSELDFKMIELLMQEKLRGR